MRKFQLWDKQKEEMLGPFTLRDIQTFERKPIIKKDNIIVEIDEIGPRYLERPPNESKEEFLED